MVFTLSSIHNRHSFLKINLAYNEIRFSDFVRWLTPALTNCCIVKHQISIRSGKLYLCPLYFRPQLRELSKNFSRTTNGKVSYQRVNNKPACLPNKVVVFFHVFCNPFTNHTFRNHKKINFPPLLINFVANGNYC